MRSILTQMAAFILSRSGRWFIKTENPELITMFPEKFIRKSSKNIKKIVINILAFFKIYVILLVHQKIGFSGNAFRRPVLRLWNENELEQNYLAFKNRGWILFWNKILYCRIAFLFGWNFGSPCPAGLPRMAGWSLQWKKLLWTAAVRFPEK